MGSKEEQLAVVEDRIRANEFDYIIASDGSKLGEGSYGKTGAAAVIYKESIENPPSTLKVSLGTESNSYYAEMKGIELGLKYMRNVEEPSKALFLSDCTSALKSSFELPVAREYTSISRINLKRARELETMGHHLEAMWVPGHSNFEPNEVADRVAKEAAEESSRVRYPAERREVVVKLVEKVKQNWQFRVDMRLANHRISNINRKVGSWFTPKLDGIHSLLQLASGHDRLNYHMSKIVETTAPFCKCGQVEDAVHFLFECECYSRFRFELLNELNSLCSCNFTRLSCFSWQTLLGQDPRSAKEIRVKVVELVLLFIRKTKRFSKEAAK